MPSSTITLTPEQIAFFHRHGYLALQPITTLDELQSMREIYDRLFEARAGREQGNFFDLAGVDDDAPILPQIVEVLQYAPQLRDTFLRANCDVIARQLGGAACAFAGDHAINKPPRSPAATPWHQDEAYWASDTVYECALSIWVPLQDVNEHNGCMQFVPGSHRAGIYPHHSINNDPRIHGLEVDASAVDVSKRAICALPAGGCTIHASATLHYTAPNRSDEPRRAYTLVYHSGPNKLAEPRDFYWNDVNR